MISSTFSEILRRKNKVMYKKVKRKWRIANIKVILYSILNECDLFFKTRRVMNNKKKNAKN